MTGVPDAGLAPARRSLFPALPILAMAHAGGVVAGAVLGGPWLMTLLVAGLFALTLLLRGDGRVLVLAAAVAFAAAGHARIEAIDAAPPPPLAALSGAHEVTGVVRADARITGSTQRIDVDVEAIDGIPAEGGVRLRLRVEDVPLRAGERIRAAVNLDAPEPIEAFDYAEYLRDRDIHLVGAFPREWERLGVADLGWRGSLHDLRRRVVERIERTLPEPAAALAAGVLVGEHGTLPAATEEALRATGTTHLVVVSGQNVALILGIAVAVLTAFISRRIASIAVLLVLPAYVVFVGAEPPVVRAAIMAVAVVAAGVTGRRTPGWIYLAYAVALMLAFDPRYVRDVAFQLSAAATAGITILAPVLRDQVLGRWPALASPGRAALVGVTATAIGAAVAVLPVQIAAFEVVAPWTVLANVLVAPLYEGTVFVAAIAGLLGGVGGLGGVLATVPDAFLGLVEMLAALPHAQIPMRAPLIAGVLFVAALGVLTAFLARRRPGAVVLDPGGSTGLATTVALAMAAGGLWWAALAPAEDHATVTVLDVGQGLAVLVRDGDRTLLIDTGPPDDAVVAALSAQGVTGRLDAVVVTHADVDHAGGLNALQRRFQVEQVLAEPSTLADIEGARPFDIGDRVRVGAVTAEVLAPPVVTRGRDLASDNNGSLVLLLTVGERRILVAGDIEAEAEAWLLAAGADLRADALVVPHHGSRSSSTPAFLAAVDPAVAVIPVGTNPYGHPHPDVLERYAALEGVALYRTDEDGSVTFRSDGDRLWVASER